MANDTRFSIQQNFDKRRDDVRELIGAGGHEICTSASGDYVPTKLNCRYFAIDTDGIVKIDYCDDWGNTYTVIVQAIAGVPMHYRNITKVYRYYTGTTNATATVFNASGSLVQGIRLLF